MDYIYDYETLNTNVNVTPILSLAGLRYSTIRFTSDDPYTFDELLALTTLEFSCARDCIIKRSKI